MVAIIGDTREQVKEIALLLDKRIKAKCRFFAEEGKSNKISIARNIMVKEQIPVIVLHKCGTRVDLPSERYLLRPYGDYDIIRLKRDVVKSVVIIAESVKKLL